MAERLDYPSRGTGNEREQILQIWLYLTRLIEKMNIWMDEIGGAELTDAEAEVMRPILSEGNANVTLKELIVKTAAAMNEKTGDADRRIRELQARIEQLETAEE